MTIDKKIADLLHHRSQGLSQHDPVSLPLTTSSVFHLPGDIGSGDQYARFGNPVWTAVEAQLSILEDAPSLIFPSGMAAIAAVFYTTLKSGDSVLLPSDGYYTSRALAETYLTPMGITFETCPTKDMSERDVTGFDLILIETPSNPHEALYTRLKEWRKFSGAICGPFDAWLLHRGLETLELRLSRMCSNAEILAARLKDHPAVIDIRYPGLKSDPSYAIAKDQMDGFGFLIALTLETRQAAEALLSTCPYIAQTTSFGSTHTSGERRARWGDDVAPGFIRLSAGCEPIEPLWAAIKTSLDEV